MNKPSNYICCVCAILFVAVLSSCSGNASSQGTFFHPKERESKFSDQEREEAIARKRAELESMNRNLDIDALVFENNIKLTVLPPAISEDITFETAQAVAVKAMQIVTMNGMGGYGNSPAFCLGTVFTPTRRVATGTAPQRMLMEYEVTYVVGNMLTGDVYGTYSQSVEGVGASFEEAAFNAVNSMQNDKGVQEMLRTSSGRILSWYNNNPQGFKSIVEESVARQEYALAYALLATVPEQAPDCFRYAQKRQEEVLEEMKMQKAEELLVDLRNAIAIAGDQYSPMAAGCLQLIPARSSQYAEGKALYDGYVARVESARRDSIDHERKVELERLAMEKMKLKFEQEAAMKSAEKAMTPPEGSSATAKAAGTDTSKFSGKKGGGLAQSFKEHPLLWGLGLGALAIGTAGVGLYAALPLTTKIGLALL